MTDHLSTMADDDRVLVAYVPKPTDFLLIETDGWYRIPQSSAPKGVFAEWIAFYFGASFGEQKYAIHVVAQNLGHELVTRRELLPHQPNHKRADAVYYKIQLGELIWLKKPIVSLKWRRLLFLHTTGDRFKMAREVNDLLVEGGDFVDRKQIALREDSAEDYWNSKEPTRYDSVTSLEEIEQVVLSYAEKIDPPPISMPTYGLTNDFAQPHIELDKGGYAWVIVERGREIERKWFSEIDDLLYQIFKSATSTMGSSYAAANPREKFDFRRLMFGYQLELLHFLKPEWADRRFEEIEEILKKNPYEDRE